MIGSVERTLLANTVEKMDLLYESFVEKGYTQTTATQWVTSLAESGYFNGRVVGQ